MQINAPEFTEQYQLDSKSEPKLQKELGQAEFLELMMAQLKNQDPMQPMDNGEFLGQMAQFSTVTGIDDMKVSLDNLSSTFASGQTLQATQLVGQEVLVENRELELTGSGGTGGLYELDSASNDVVLDISDESGTVIRQIKLEENTAGRHSFEWDGLNDDGRRVPPGNYSATVNARFGEEYLSVPVLTSRLVESVEFGDGNQTTLNTRRGDSLSLADVRQIRNSITANDSKS